MQVELTLPLATANAKTTPALKACGVYAIRHRDSGKLYVGSTSRKSGIVARLCEHRSRLNKRRHENTKLQECVTTYGIDAFDFLVIEFCGSKEARPREQHWLDTTRAWEVGFNTARSIVDYHPQAASTRAALVKRASKPYKLQFEGCIFEGENLTEFCRIRGLHQGAMTQVLLGQKPQFKGWTLPGKALPPRIVKYHPTGETVPVNYFEGAKFAHSRGLNVARVNCLLAGRIQVYKGWTLATTEVSDEELRISLLPHAEKCRINGRKSVDYFKARPPRHHTCLCDPQ